jgi:hypothetical protein
MQLVSFTNFTIDPWGRTTRCRSARDLGLGDLRQAMLRYTRRVVDAQNMPDHREHCQELRRGARLSVRMCWVASVPRAREVMHESPAEQ